MGGVGLDRHACSSASNSCFRRVDGQLGPSPGFNRVHSPGSPRIRSSSASAGPVYGAVSGPSPTCTRSNRSCARRATVPRYRRRCGRGSAASPMRADGRFRAECAGAAVTQLELFPGLPLDLKPPRPLRVLVPLIKDELAATDVIRQ